MIVSVVNFTNEILSDGDIHKAIRAVNRQIQGDFAPYWSFGATLRLEGRVGKRPRSNTAQASPVNRAAASRRDEARA